MELYIGLLVVIAIVCLIAHFFQQAKKKGWFDDSDDDDDNLSNQRYQTPPKTKKSREQSFSVNSYLCDPYEKYPDLRTVHPDIMNLLYVVNNYPHSHLVNSEPSTIYTMLPISKNITSEPTRPLSYYPTYLGMDETHKAIYFNFLSDPYVSGYDIGYVFCLYYGLERQMLKGDLDSAFEVILKLKLIYDNKSFQKYSNIAVILTLMRKRRYDLLERFIDFIREYNMLILPVDIFLFALVAIDGVFTAEDLVEFKNDFDYKSTTYTKDKKFYFIDELNETMLYIFGTDSIKTSDLMNYREELKTTSYNVYANRSLCEITAEIPEFSKFEVFKNSCYDALMDAHENLKRNRIKS